MGGASKMAEARGAGAAATCWCTFGTTELRRGNDFPLPISTISWKSFVLKQQTTFSKKTGGLKKSSAGQGKDQCLTVDYNVYTFDPLYLAGLLLRKRFFNVAIRRRCLNGKTRFFFTTMTTFKPNGQSLDD